MTDHATVSGLIQRLRSRGAQLWEEQGKMRSEEHTSELQSLV